MNFNQHYNLAGKHAFLSASQSYWLRYTPEKLRSVYVNNLKKEEGTKLHAMASDLIVHRIKVAKLKKAFNQFVNDAIGFQMESELVLYYSDNCFGTADAISFKDGLLRIHDLKTGAHPVKFAQLDVYAALFCLEYGVDPNKIEIEQRIYQGSEVLINVPTAEEIATVMDIIEQMDKELEKIKSTIG